MRKPHKERFHNIKLLWSDEDNATLIRMWKEGYTATEIGEKLGKTKGCIGNYVRRNRDWLGIEKRPTHYRKQGWRSVTLQKLFDKEWKGGVPLKHWIITQSWSKR